MNWSVLRLLYIHELKMLVRARRTVVMAIVIPALIMPLLLYAQKYSADRRDRLLAGATYRYAVTGTLADRVRRLIEQTREKIAREDGDDFRALKDFRFVELKTQNLRDSLARDEIQFYIEALSGEEADRVPQKADTPDKSASTSTKRRSKGVPLLNIVYREDRDSSDNAHRRVISFLRVARQ